MEAANRVMGRRIRKLRVEQGLTQVDLGKAVGMNQGYLSELESGAPYEIGVDKISGEVPDIKWL